MATTEERLDALDKKLDQALRGLALLCRHLGAVAQPGKVAAPAEKRIASDEEIDGEHGDKEVRKDPKKWTGESRRGWRWSQCEPDYLDALAKYHDSCAFMKRKEAGSLSGEEQARALKYADYDENDAAKCRAWAKRLRAQETDL